jgi:hypothetical protein
MSMQSPTAATLVEAWDRGAHVSHAERALLLLKTIRPEPWEALARMPIGWVSAQLLKLRASVVGPTLVCLVDCRECHTIVESEVEVDQLTGPVATPPVGPFSLTHGGYHVEFRLPTYEDVLTVRGDRRTGARLLAQALIASAEHDGAAVEIATVPDEVTTALEPVILAHDPLAQIELSLTCPGCGREWSETLDVVDFVWTEISTFAQRVITEVARLAYAFGWREADILAMSDHRRRRYLELLPS